MPHYRSKGVFSEKQHLQLPWSRPEWLEEATAWIHDQVAAHGRRVAGPVEIVHQRPWAAFAQVPTDMGIVYFKAPSPAVAHETALTEALARWRPDCTVPLLAVDLERGWILSADARVTLRSLGRTPKQVEHWLKVLPLTVDLQLDMADRVPELLALGVPDRRLDHFPRLYAQLLEDVENVRVGLERGLTRAEYHRLLNLRPRVAEMCAQLASYGLPETLAHEEVHENNVIIRDGHYTFELACRLAMVNRALSYHDTMGALAEKEREQYLDSIPGWLQEFLRAEAAA